MRQWNQQGTASLSSMLMTGTPCPTYLYDRMSLPGA